MMPPIEGAVLSTPLGHVCAYNEVSPEPQVTRGHKFCLIKGTAAFFTADELVT